MNEHRGIRLDLVPFVNIINKNNQGFEVLCERRTNLTILKSCLIHLSSHLTIYFLPCLTALNRVCLVAGSSDIFAIPLAKLPTISLVIPLFILLLVAAYYHRSSLRLRSMTYYCNLVRSALRWSIIVFFGDGLGVIVVAKDRGFTLLLVSYYLG